MRSLSICLVFGATGLLAQGGDTGELVEKRDNATLMVPVVAAPSAHWEGVDGTWSTFTIRVGTPVATYRVLPATSWQETWVVYGAAAQVCNTSVGVKADCEEDRGGFFDSAKSSTWKQGDQYQLQLEEMLGYEGVGQYGFDTVGLGFRTDTGPTLPNQIVSEIVSDDWWFGMLGMGFQPTNFTGYETPQASFADTLYTNGTISSMSWSYTAGAYYRLKSIFGSLIFGGYDASKFTPNSIRFSMASDNLRDLVVTIRSITSTTSAGNTTLMSTPIFAFIDSAVPDFYLPVSVCKQFEKAFGITLDQASGRYLIDNTTHEKLKALNPNVTFTLANQKEGGETTDIFLPYAAFDLNITAPILTNSSSLYFPLKQTSDENLYALGRAFLQEAYVTAHYNSRTFNVSQALFSDNASPTLVALPATLPTSSTSPGSNNPNSANTPSSPSSRTKLSGGAIAGIVIGSLAGLALLFLLIFFLLRRRRRHTSTAKAEAEREPVHEIDSGKRVDPAVESTYSAQASALTSEVSGKDSRVEKWGVPIMHPQELEADVPGKRGTKGNEAEMAGGSARMSPIKETKTKTPMAELGVEERGLGEGEGEGAGVGGERERERDGESSDHIVSPNTDRWSASVMGRNRGDVTASSPSGPSEGSWSPSTPVQRRNSRFSETWT
ncbi:aspartic peptidase domain-containing protein [Leptodontidium sp. MPI-SDFR-AT-0119]|nr:aspartic peptidase domain-containing protein [Leptodontidium sp. MPI-SDFR-AT-0119]